MLQSILRFKSSIITITLIVSSIAIIGGLNNINFTNAQTNNNLSSTSNSNSSIINSPNGISAETIYKQKSGSVANNIKNFVVLIPNEGHESINQKKSQWPLANQPYIPQNIEITKGTHVTWFNGDVDHIHIIKFQTPINGNLTETETFPYLGYVTVQFNNAGQYPYFEDGDLNDDKSFKMEGIIKVTDSDGSQGNNTQSNLKTLGVLMVPSKDQSSISDDLSTKGLKTLSTFTFEDIRGGQKGTGPTQSIILWGSDSDSIDQIVSTLKDVSEKLPYS